MMLNLFKKKTGDMPANQEASQEAEQAGALPEQQKEELMSDVTTHVELAAHEAVVAELAALKTEMDSFKAASDAMKAEFEEKLAAYAAAEEQAKADALAVKMAARKEKAEAQMGTEKAEAFLAATEGMSDDKVEAFFAIFATNATAEANSEMFNEVGAEGQTTAEDAPKVMHFNKYLPKKKETK